MPLTARQGRRRRRRRPRDGARRCARGRSESRAPGRRAGRSTLGQRRADRPARPSTVLAAERRHDRPDVDAVGRPEQLLVVLGQADLGRVGGRLRQEREDPAAVVVDQHDRRRQAVQPRGHQGVEVVQERHVADDEHDRPDRPPPRPSAVDTTPSMPFAPRFDSGRIARSLAGQPVVQVADRHAVARPTGAPPSGSDAAEHGERQALERLVAGLHAASQSQRRVGRPIGVAPGACPRPARRRGRGRSSASASAQAVVAHRRGRTSSG